jgi:hypothetical protein
MTSSGGWQALTTKSKSVYGLGDKLTVRGYSRGGRFRNYGLISVWAEESRRWLSLLVDPEGRPVCSGIGETENDAAIAINVQTESIFGERYSSGLPGAGAA